MELLQERTEYPESAQYDAPISVAPPMPRFGSNPDVRGIVRSIVERYLNAEFPQKALLSPIAEIALSEAGALLECGLPKPKRSKGLSVSEGETLEAVSRFVTLVRRILASEGRAKNVGRLLAMIRVRVQIASKPLDAAFATAFLHIARLEAVAAIPSETMMRFSQMREDFAENERDEWRRESKPVTEAEKSPMRRYWQNDKSADLPYWKSLLDEEVRDSEGNVFVLRKMIEETFRMESGIFWENFRDVVTPLNRALKEAGRPTLSIQSQGVSYQFTGKVKWLPQEKFLASLGLSFPGVLVGPRRSNRKGWKSLSLK